MAAAWLAAAPALDQLGGAGADRAPRAATDPALGARLFAAEGCAVCHPIERYSAEPDEPELNLARALDRAAERIGDSDYSGVATTPREYVRESILDHCRDVAPGYSCAGAPDVGLRLGVDEVEALVTYVVQLAGEAK